MNIEINEIKNIKYAKNVASHSAGSNIENGRLQRTNVFPLPLVGQILHLNSYLKAKIGIPNNH